MASSGHPSKHLWRFLPSIRVPAVPREQISIRNLALQTWNETLADRLVGHAAELGFYFLFALFPTLFSAASVLGLIARSAHQITESLLDNLALVIPTSALSTVLNTFNETTASATSGKITFGSIAAIWSASVGISAIQDTLNAVFKLNNRRSYIVARLEAILLTILLTLLISAGLGCMVGGEFSAAWATHQISAPLLSIAAASAVRIFAWGLAASILALSFGVLYYWAPDWEERRWRWLTPGTVFGVAGWLASSLGFRVYLHFFNNFNLLYGSLGAVIILLTWFYISGLMLLLGAEIDSVVDEAAAEAQLANDTGASPPSEF